MRGAAMKSNSPGPGGGPHRTGHSGADANSLVTTKRVVVLACLAASLVPAPGRAEDKKKPGLFDFEGWKTPVVRQRDAAKTLAPGTLDIEPLGRFETPPRALRMRVYTY